MNDLSGTVRDRQYCCCCWGIAGCARLPRPVLCVVAPLLLLGVAVSAFILAVVHNAVFFVLLLALSALVVSVLVWNAYGALKDEAVLLFVDRFPDSDLGNAKEGDLVKVTGQTSVAMVEFATSVHTICKTRFTADFHLTDIKSGTRVMVKAGFGSKITSLIKENILVKTTGKSGSLSSTLRRWLAEKHLSTEARFLRLEEGYAKEGSYLTVIGIVNKCNTAVTIVPLQEPVSTGCILQKFLLPVDVDGLIVKLTDNLSSVTSPNCSQNTC